MPPLAPSDRLAFVPAPNALPHPDPGEVHLWRISLSAPPPDNTTLSETERTRHSRFHFEKDRHRFLTTHVARRAILARYLQVSAQDLEFDHGEWGKPFLPPPFDQLQFNLSYSRDWALFAVAGGTSVGVDVEFQKTGIEVLSLAEAILALSEAAHFAHLDPAQQFENFYATWAAKESYLKALGTGLSLDPRATEVIESKTDRTLGVVRTLAHPEDQPYQLYRLDLAPNYSAALCTPREICALHPYAY